MGGLAMSQDVDALNREHKIVWDAHERICRRKGKDYAPDVHELQAEIDKMEEEKRVEEANNRRLYNRARRRELRATGLLTDEEITIIINNETKSRDETH